MTTVHTIDAKNKKLGRVASEAAVFLMGKNAPDFAANKIALVQVKVENISDMLIDEKKRNEKEYVRYTGYPGGLRKETMDELIAKKGYSEVFKKAVYGMLPANKLRKERLKRLIIKE